MAKKETIEELKSALLDNSDIPIFEDLPNTEFVVKPSIDEYKVYKKNDSVEFISGIGEGVSVSFKPEENNYNYQDYLAWVDQGNVAEEIAL